MLTPILAIVASLAGFTVWWVKRKADKNDAAQQPGSQNKTRYEQIDQDIHNADSAAATAHSNADLDELDRLQRGSGDQRGSN